ncbi:MAG TPA: glycosyl hydrolase 115 family protein [Gemmatimonadaceae bacterium]
MTVSICALSAGAIGAQSPYVSFAPTPGAFALVAEGKAASIVVGEKDYVGVVRVVRDLRADIARVTGITPTIDTSDAPKRGSVVLVGTIGRSALVDALIAAGRLDVGGVRGKWETWVSQVIEHPFPNVDRALVIAGSDKRGTIYGAYELSKAMGVSPWYWWADVPVERRTTVYVDAARRSDGEPAVKYRGVFLNDEAPALSGFAREKFGGFNHQFYEKVFELILRLRGNYLWPAMWGNAFNDDDRVNPRLADEYGIVMGTSHHEPMLRAQQEWKRYGKGEWNYDHNDSTLRAFWTQGIRNMGSDESIVTVGMRGDGDMPMTEGSNISLLERIVKDQRDIIANVTNKPASETPQVWALYKEVQDYYDKGMRVPDDVTLLFSDDNWGNIRRLPARADTARKGGFGVYYHFDYVGGPRNYKWINTNPIARIWEQMNLAHEYGANRIWIVNVGDLKPMEFPISFFLDYAWNPDRIPPKALNGYTQSWAAQQFRGGSALAPEIADVMTRTLKLAGRRKPELLDTVTYSLTNFREFETAVAQYDSLELRAERIGKSLPAAYADAYYELVQHPIDANANLTRLYFAAARNRMYAAQGRARTNELADSVEALFNRDAEITTRYNTTLAGGKWAHMMDQTHIGYTYWQEPPRNTMPRVDRIQLPVRGEMGVALVEQNRAPSGRSGFPAREIALPTFDAYTRPTFHIDVYNRGTAAFTYSAKASQPWVMVSPSSGIVNGEQRLTVRVDWNRAPRGRSKVLITISGANDARVVVDAVIDNPASPRRDALDGFVETNGYVAIDAEHVSRVESGSAGVEWVSVPDLGKTGSAMIARPVTLPAQQPGGKAPHLEYRVFMFDSGTVQVNAYLSPTFNFAGSPNGLRYAVSFDDQTPVIVDAQADTTTRLWEREVAENIVVKMTTHTLMTAGAHTLKIWLIDPGIVFQRFVVEARPMPASYLGAPESYRAPGLTARFDWFEYRGNDSVYRTINPSTAEYLNPILPGFYPDPSITRGADAYYLVTSSFAYFPGVPMFRSTDLVHWTQIGHVLDRPSQLNLDGAGISRGIFAPTIRYHAGTYYMITTLIDRGGNFIVTAKNPAGPWSDPIWLRGFDGIDPSLFFDDDGKAYIINNGPPEGAPLYEGHRAIWIQEYDVAAQTLAGPRKLIVNGGVDLSKKPIWIEAPHVLKVKGAYYLICAEGGTGDQHSEVVFKAASVFGPYVPAPSNPILTQRQLGEGYPFAVTSTGHADFVQTPQGEWWSVFLGTRPYAQDVYNTGRETFLLPVQWTGEWPSLLTGNQKVPYVARRPAGASTAPIANTGNFVVRDEFDDPTLALSWEFMRTPREEWYDLTSTRGALTIRARRDSLSGKGQPSWIGRRQQHLTMSVSTAVRFTPLRVGDEAGLSAFQSENAFYALAVARTKDTTVVQLRRRAGKDGIESIVASIPVKLDASQPMLLRIDARGGKYDFYYAQRTNGWLPLTTGEDGSILSTKKAGGFVGTMLGIYAIAGQ